MVAKDEGTMKCIVCLGDFAIDFSQADGWVSCASGIVCEATGNYGSTSFDPMHGGEVMQFLLCDGCAKARGAHISVFQVRTDRPKVHRVKKTFADYVVSDFEMDTYKAFQELRGEDPDADTSSGPVS